MSPVVREMAWGIAGLAFTAMVFRGAAWSYPQGAETIWIVGGVTMIVIALLAGRAVALCGPRSGGAD
jgi:hypothetical protein